MKFTQIVLDQERKADAPVLAGALLDRRSIRCRLWSNERISHIFTSWWLHLEDHCRISASIRACGRINSILVSFLCRDGQPNNVHECWSPNVLATRLFFSNSPARGRFCFGPWKHPFFPVQLPPIVFSCFI
jgi:hypothetical protein